MVDRSKARGDAVDHDLSLTLELHEQAASGYRFGLVLRNRSDTKLLVPYPRITGLRFGNKATIQESEWCSSFLQSAFWNGFTLEPSEEKAIEYQVRPSDIEAAAEDDDTDRYRWCVVLPPGEYQVWFRFEVGEDYYCCDSHYRYEHLLREAEDVQAVVWTGHALSNRFGLIRG